MNRTAASQPRKAVAFIQAAAARAARKEGAATIFKFKAAEGAAEHVAEGGTFPPLSAPFVQDPGQKDRPQHDAEVDQNQIVKADRNHGAVGGRA